MPNDRSFMSAFVRRVAGLLSRPPRPFVIDESCIAVARPGDLVLLRLPEPVTGEQMDRYRTVVAAKLQDLAPGVRFVVIDHAWRAAVISGAGE